MTDTKEANNEKDLEKQVEFSWRSVFRGWVQNLKDDIDPAIKGAKMGVFGLHAIPTWMRQHDEGKMSTEKPGLSGLLGLVVAGSSIAGYTMLGRHINQTTDSDWGYAMIGVPVAAQGLSWAYEAFLRAKKTEQSKVVMTRLEKTLNVKSEGYDVCNQDLVEAVADRLYQSVRDATEKRIESAKSRMGSWKKEKGENVEYGIQQCESAIAAFEDDLKNYTPVSLKQARKGILCVARNVFNGLVADRLLGKQYSMSTELETGPVKRECDRNAELWDEEDDAQYPQFVRQDVLGIISAAVKDAVQSKNGSAKIELFGTVTAIYTNDGKDMHYEVTPNKNLWKV